MQRDRIDFGEGGIRKLFVRQLAPTMMGMISTALFIITDGIFVGRGIGSDALAAVNIVAPLYMVATGLALMFGMGGAIVASIHLSRGKARVAGILTTQSLVTSCAVILPVTLAAMIAPKRLSTTLGAEGTLLAPAAEYLFWYALFLVFTVIDSSMPFFVRLSRPKYAMWVLLLSAGMNILLDYLYIFVFGWGLTGAAVATGTGQAMGALLLIRFLMRPQSAVRLTRFKASLKSLRLTLRNMAYTVRLGFPALLGEGTLALMMLVGNYVFISYLGKDGVAAYSIICYLVPVLFMLFNGIIQSAQPIISYNYGLGEVKRYKRTFFLALQTGIAASLACTVVMVFFSRGIVSLFVADLQGAAARYADEGLRLFSVDLVFFAFNMICIGYYMSIERMGRAVLITLMRGFFPVVTFFTLPSLLGVNGIWLAVPAAEAATTLYITASMIYDRRTIGRRIKTLHRATISAR